MAHDVFISYASEDKPTADATCAALEARGIRCWIAPRDVLPGVIYSAAIVEAIHASRAFVLVFSARSNDSPHVMREVERAVNRGLPIIPFRIEDVPLSPSMEYFISTPHWLDALTPPLRKHLAHLAETVGLLLARAEPEMAGLAGGPRPEPGPAVGVPERRPAAAGWTNSPRARQAALAMAALAGLAVVAWAGSTLLAGGAAPTSPPTEPPAAAATRSPDAEPTPRPIDPTASTGSPTSAPGGGLVRAFAAPGDTAAGLAWDGANLWVSGSTELFKVDPAGKVLGVFAPPGYTPEGLAWDGSTFWLFTTDGSEIYRFGIDESSPDEEPSILDTIQPPSRTIGGGINHGLAWDGTGLWFSDSFSVYRLDTSGQVRTTLAFAREVSGLAWDGERLWLAQMNWPDPATLAVADSDGNVSATIPTPLMEVTSMVWADGQLVVAGSGDLAGQPEIWRLERESGS
jgi:hypothetical protein